MRLLTLAFLLWLSGALVALLCRRRALGLRLGVAAALTGSVAAGMSAAAALTQLQGQLWHAPWGLVGAGLALRIDPLAAVFLLMIGVIGAACSVFGLEYMKHQGPGADHGSFAWYNLLLASMALVVSANDLILLLIAWEVMTLSSWVLVVTDHADTRSRVAGLIYLTAAHIATAALILLVLLLTSGSGSFQIDNNQIAAGAPAGALFLLALVGFGTKAGLLPTHVWLPDAHPAAPSHVSAVMSAVMITMGFYGLARFLPLLGEPAAWWAYLLIGLGAAGAMGGILFAIAQRDVKRILAYSTIENAGVVAVAVGLGLLGAALDQPVLAGFGWTAAFLHLWNHALAKSALFLGFGAVVQAAGTRELDLLGGLLQRWRLLGALLLVLAGSMAALPGLNLFTSEWLLLNGLLTGGLSLQGLPQVMLLIAVVSLAFAGALALACFTRLAGIGLLGSARSAAIGDTHEPAWLMSIPVMLLAVGCVATAAFPRIIAETLAPAVGQASPISDLGAVHRSLDPVGWLLPMLAAAIAAAAARVLLATRVPASRSGTWACGYATPTAAMQYTASSFGEPLTRVLQPVLRSDTDATSLAAANAGGHNWPEAMRWSSQTLDLLLAAVYRPLFEKLRRTAARVRAFYQPRVSTSILYIVITVLLLLALLFLPVESL